MVLCIMAENGNVADLLYFLIEALLAYQIPCCNSTACGLTKKKGSLMIYANQKMDPYQHLQTLHFTEEFSATKVGHMTPIH